jgi:ectoine hydroxylase
MEEQPMGSRILTDEEIAQFHKDGYVLVRSLFDAKEMELLRGAREIDDAMKENVHTVDDREGGRVKLALWNEAGGDIYGLFSRGHRIVDSVERLLAFQDDPEGALRGRSLDVAPGLRILVLRRLPVS